MAQKSLLNSYKRKSRIKKVFLALLFLLPAIICFVIFKYLPTFQTLYYSFFKYNMIDPPGRFVGVRNYTNALRSEIFWMSFKNTVVLYGWGLVLGFWVPIVQAICISELVRGKTWAKLGYLIPTGMSGLAGLSVWKYIWEPEGGLANQFMNLFGLGPYQWYGDEALVKFCLRFPAILGGGGMVIILFVSILNISAELYDAAKIDGANAFQRIFHITLPGMKYTIFTTFIMGLTGSLLAFDDVYMVTQGGPGYASYTVVLGIYRKAFQEQNWGMAMSMSWILCIITFIITALVFYIQGRTEDSF